MSTGQTNIPLPHSSSDSEPLTVQPQSHTLWYTSSRNPQRSPGAIDSSHQYQHQHHHHHHHHLHHHNADAPPSAQQSATQQRQRSQQILERTALARLSADELYMHMRRVNVQNFGSTWLRPPGVPKTLHQTREEKREQEEHQEAMRREQLAQELAEAEAEAGAGAIAGAGPGGVMADPGGVMDDIQLDGAQDLDAEIPDAPDLSQFGYSDAEEEEEDDDDDDDDEEEEEDDDDDDDDDDEEEEEGGEEVGAEADDDNAEEEDEEEEEEDDIVQAAAETEVDTSALREERRDLMAARMRITDDAFREALVRGDPEGGNDLYGGDEDPDDADRGHMLDEDDLAPAPADGTLLDDDGGGGGGLLLEGDMDANLDDDIPEADAFGNGSNLGGGGYEHTDSEAEFTSSGVGGGGVHSDSDTEGGGNEENDEDMIPDVSFAPRAAPLGPPQSPTLRASGLGGPRYRASLDLSGLLSQDESSFMESSPAQGRRTRRR